MYSRILDTYPALGRIVILPGGGFLHAFAFLSVVIWHSDEQGWIHSMRTKLNGIYEDCEYRDDQMYVGKPKERRRRITSDLWR